MKIIYAYKRNIYAAYRAAYLRLRLDTTLLRDLQLELMKSHIRIRPLYLGIDEDFNEIYIANYGRKANIFKNSLEGLGKIHEEEVEVVLFD